VVNERTRMCLQPRRNEVHGGLEGVFFGLSIMRPVRRKSGFAIIDGDKAKEVFETAVLEELRTLHIEKDVPGMGTRQPGETLTRHHRQCFDIIGAGVALRGLQRRLMPQANEGLRLDSGNS
jgi:hypothetical protein